MKQRLVWSGAGVTKHIGYFRCPSATPPSSRSCAQPIQLAPIEEFARPQDSGPSLRIEQIATTLVRTRARHGPPPNEKARVGRFHAQRPLLVLILRRVGALCTVRRDGVGPPDPRAHGPCWWSDVSAVLERAIVGMVRKRVERVPFGSGPRQGSKWAVMAPIWTGKPSYVSDLVGETATSSHAAAHY